MALRSQERARGVDGKVLRWEADRTRQEGIKGAS